MATKLKERVDRAIPAIHIAVAAHVRGNSEVATTATYIEIISVGE